MTMLEEHKRYIAQVREEIHAAQASAAVRENMLSVWAECERVWRDAGHLLTKLPEVWWSHATASQPEAFIINQDARHTIGEHGGGHWQLWVGRGGAVVEFTTPAFFLNACLWNARWWTRLDEAVQQLAPQHLFVHPARLAALAESVEEIRWHWQGGFSPEERRVVDAVGEQCRDVLA